MTTLLALLPIALFLLSVYMSPRHYLITKIIITLLLITSMILMERAKASGTLEEIDTLYSHVRVYDWKDPTTGENLRTMGINKENHSTRSLDSDRLVNDYTNFYHLARHFFPGFRSGLMLGGAGYSFPQSYLSTYPDAFLDVIEIDPGVTDLARKYF
jgi:hypothetical protein